MRSLRFTLLTLVGAGLLALCALVLSVAAGAHLADKAVQKGLDAKDVLADVLPPPLYLVELRLVLGLAVDGTMAVRLKPRSDAALSMVSLGECLKYQLPK